MGLAGPGPTLQGVTVARRKQTAHQVQVRRRLVRRLLVEGMAEGEIVQVLVQGVQGPDGKPIKVSEATARRDLAAVSAEFAAIFDSDEAVEREIGAAWEAYKAIARKAQAGSRPNYHAAISALDRVVRIAASRSERWRHLAGAHGRRASEGDAPPLVEGDDAELLARAQEVARMDDRELLAHHRQLRQRIADLGLEVVDGGTAAAEG